MDRIVWDESAVEQLLDRAESSDAVQGAESNEARHGTSSDMDYTYYGHTTMTVPTLAILTMARRMMAVRATWTASRWLTSAASSRKPQ